MTLGSAPVPDATTIFSALTLADGSTLIGTSPNGKVYKATGDAVALFADTGALAVTSIVQAKNGTVYAATMPDGKVFKLTQGQGGSVRDPRRYEPRLGARRRQERHRPLRRDRSRRQGLPHRAERRAARSTSAATEPHLVSLAIAENGDLYAGSSGKGQLYKITGPGRATVLGDFPGEEVKAIAVGKGGVVWAIANEYGEPPEPPKRSAAAGRMPAGPSSPPKGKPGKGSSIASTRRGAPSG